MAEVPSPQRLAALREQHGTLVQHVDVGALEARAGELEEAMGAPGFWDDQDNAAKANTEYARVKKRLDTYEGLDAEVEEFEGLAELVAEDPDLAAEFGDRIAAVEGQLSELEEQRLFAGE